MIRHTIILVMLALGAAGVFVKADVVFTTNGQEIECKILNLTPEVVTMRVKRGTITIEASRIKKIDYDYQSRMDNIDTSDPKQLHELGLYLIKQNRDNEALEVLEKAATLPNADAEVFLTLGEMYDRNNDIKQAIIYYRKYLKEHPGDKKTGMRVNALTKSLTQPADAVANTQQNNRNRNRNNRQENATQTEALPAWEGMEAQKGWIEERWGNRVFSEIARAEGDQNNRLMRISFVDRGKSKAAIHKVYKQDLSSRKGLVMDAYNANERPMHITLAVRTNPGQQWFESKQKTLRPSDWTTGILFDFEKHSFKSESRGWNFKTGIDNLENTYQIVILIYNNNLKEGQIFLDNLRIIDVDEQ